MENQDNSKQQLQGIGSRIVKKQSIDLSYPQPKQLPSFNSVDSLNSSSLQNLDPDNVISIPFDEYRNLDYQFQLIFQQLKGLKENSEVQLDIECLIQLNNKFDDLQIYRIWKIENALKFNYFEMTQQDQIKYKFNIYLDFAKVVEKNVENLKKVQLIFQLIVIDKILEFQDKVEKNSNDSPIEFIAQEKIVQQIEKKNSINSSQNQSQSEQRQRKSSLKKYSNFEKQLDPIENQIVNIQDDSSEQDSDEEDWKMQKQKLENKNVSSKQKIHFAWAQIDLYNKETQKLNLNIEKKLLTFYKMPLGQEKESTGITVLLNAKKHQRIASDLSPGEDNCQQDQFFRKMNLHYTQMRYTKFNPGEPTGRFLSKKTEASIKINKLFEFRSDLYVDFKILIVGQEKGGGGKSLKWERLICSHHEGMYKQVNHQQNELIIEEKFQLNFKYNEIMKSYPNLEQIFIIIKVLLSTDLTHKKNAFWAFVPLYQDLKQRIHNQGTFVLDTFEFPISQTLPPKENSEKSFSRSLIEVVLNKFYRTESPQKQQEQDQWVKRPIIYQKLKGNDDDNDNQQDKDNDNQEQKQHISSKDSKK